jgi:hypothetical protein
MAMASPQRIRLEQGFRAVSIMDDTGHSITLLPAKKLAIVTTYTNLPKEKGPKSIFFELRSQLADARNRPDWIREPLGLHFPKKVDSGDLMAVPKTGSD